MNLANLLEACKAGTHPACQGCPWSPKNAINSAFGVSCQQHGVDWSKPISALSVQIVQDPAGTTPEKTGNLCFVCNSRNVTDKTAQHAYGLWKAAVSLAQSGPAANRYLERHYWMNAIMHGVKDDKTRDDARVYCKSILRDQLVALSPQIIIACGKVACESLFELNLITRHWDDFSRAFSKGVYREQVMLPSKIEATVFCTHHSSARAVNTHLANHYSPSFEDLLTSKINHLPDASYTKTFLKNYPSLETEGRGMRVSLLHWLEIGESIRKAKVE